jgi:hypothetical protein
MKQVLGAFALIFALSSPVAFAAPSQSELVNQALAAQVRTTQIRLAIEAQVLNQINWRVGDSADYKMNGGFIQGTSLNSVTKDEGTSIWMKQDMDLGFMGKQLIEVLINKSTGEIEKMIVNGQEQQKPEKPDIEVLEMKESKVTVTAGEYECIYVKIKDRQKGTTAEAWLNPKLVPMNGMIKAIQESQFGPIEQELTRSAFAP